MVNNTSHQYEMKLLTQDQQNLKAYIHEGIENIDDEEYLLTIKALIDRKYPLNPTQELHPKQTRRVNQAVQSLDEGFELSDNEANKRAGKWLNE